jgi:hypothetical protein
MNSFTKWVILAALILAVLTCYSYGSSTGLFVFIIIGEIFELAFWFGVFQKKTSIPARKNTTNKLFKHDNKQFAVSSHDILANNFLPLNRVIW